MIEKLGRNNIIIYNSPKSANFSPPQNKTYFFEEKKYFSTLKKNAASSVMNV